MNNNKNNKNNDHNTPAPSGTGSGSISDTLKGYVNVAMTKGHEALEQAKVLGHHVQEQFTQATAQPQAKTTGHDSTHNSSTGTQMSQNHPTANSGDAFGDLDNFNTQANQAASQASRTENEAASHAGYKSTQSGL